jgi:UDP-glucuronate 4-epimerase
MNQPKHIIVTGGAGFIGSHVTEQLLNNGFRVTVVDNFDDFYSRAIKESNLQACQGNPLFKLVELDILDHLGLERELTDQYHGIIHLAAKAGVRPSILDPVAYQQTNVSGTQNLLEFARKKSINQFVFASSSSVYGINKNVPWQEEENLLNPISPYASTKISGELMGHVYSHLYNIRFIALRFFTVFGPRQRPDLAIHAFTKKIMNSEAIPFFGNGDTRRDYTYVKDIVNGILAALEYQDSLYEIINLGNHQTISLNEMVSTLESVIGTKAIIDKKPEQPGDVPQTYADIQKAKKLLNYNPSTQFEEGVKHFHDWLTTSKIILPA